MTPAWVQRQAELLRDCLVSPDVFQHMVDRLRDFAVSYQHALETKAGQRNVYLYLTGLLSHLPRKNAEDIATLVLHMGVAEAPLLEMRGLIRKGGFGINSPD